MTRTAIGFLGLLVLLPALQARDKPETLTPAQQYRALVKEYETAYVEYRKALAKTKTREEAQKVFQEKNPDPEKFAPRFLELAEKYPKDPAAVDALIWIASRDTKQRGPQGPRSKALQILLRNHIQSEKMATLCGPLGFVQLGYAQDKESQQLLHAVLEKSKHRLSQGRACFALARQAEGCLRAVRELKDDPVSARKNWEFRLSKDVVDALAKASPDKLSKEAEAYYERVIKDFADVAYPGRDTFGEIATKNLDELRHPILVGKPVPEIEGEDIDGVKFKLSDYRGKVVLLDFWGHW
jgi:hypothetical protein